MTSDIFHSFLFFQFVDKHPVRAPPSLLYKNVILAGARQNQLPKEYIAFLESVEDNGNEGDPNAEWLQPILEAISRISNTTTTS